VVIWPISDHELLLSTEHVLLIWHVISRSGVVISITNCYIWFSYLLTYFYGCCWWKTAYWFILCTMFVYI